MTASIESTVAAHEERLNAHEKREDRLEAKLDVLVWFVLATLVSSVGGLFVLVFGKH
jgi:hypothetical protein